MAYWLFVLLLIFTWINSSLLFSTNNEDLHANYKKCPAWHDDVLNVHLVCHTHNDVGWLKTVDQYFYGANQTIQRAGVQYILDSVIQALQHDPSKKFIYVETAFFWRWWSQLHDSSRHAVKKLVCDGQLEFIGGGWSMNDEAATHYNPIIDQMTWGHRRLQDAFGDCAIPKVSWQIDPFGHSREQASLFAQMFFDGLFFGRLDYQDKTNREENKTMELIWEGSYSLGSEGHLFTGVLPNGYSPPAGFCYDILCNDPPIMDDPDLKDYNLDERVEKFINASKEQAKNYVTNHIIMTMGEDFNYQTADSWYKNLDKLIQHVNAKTNDSKVNVFYSTPSCYLYALNQANKTWTTKKDDFLPYASDPHAYWTGYFTSRPAIKRFERMGNNILQACKQLASVADVDDFDVVPLREAMGIMQHHDAVTGTEKQHVAYDYAQTLTAAVEVCQTNVVNDAFKKIMPKNKVEVPHQFFCNYLNISECNITETDKPVAVTVYNPLAWNFSTYIHLPVMGKAYKVYNPNGDAIPVQIVDVSPSVLAIPGRKSKTVREIVFKADLPALGYATYMLNKSESKSLVDELKSLVRVKTDSDWIIKNEFYTVIVDSKTGLLKTIQMAGGANISIHQSFYWYRGMNGNNSEFNDRASGAYIFRPNGTEPILLAEKVNVTHINGTEMQEIHQVFNSWLSQSIRLYKGVENVQFDWVVGPIPVSDEIGKEIISRFDTDFDTRGQFFTDSNGREIQSRLRNTRPTWELNVTEPVSGNYYPVNSRIYLRDNKRNLQLAVLTERSQGGSSLKDGSLELMIHRRLLHDDAFGVGEALNEPGVDGKGLVIRGSHYLIISDIPSGASKHRLLGQKLYMQPQLSFAFYNTQKDYMSNYRTMLSALNATMPPNVHFLTLEPWKKNTILLRLEHFYEVGESDNLSKPVTVDLENFFSMFRITSINETTLSANQLLKEAKRLTWNSKKSMHFVPEYRGPPFKESRKDDLKIELGPMKIRTFIAEVEYAEELSI